MFRFKSIAHKTFVFTSALLMLVILISFGILYFVMPGYYVKIKMNALDRNTEELAKNLSAENDVEKYSFLIKDFIRENNSDIVTLDKDSNFIPFLSSPFISVDDETQGGTFLRSVYLSQDPAEDGRPQLKILMTTENKLYFRENADSASVTKKVSNKDIGYITVHATLQPIDEAKGVLLSLIPYLLILDIVIVIAGAYVYSKKLTNPILKIAASTIEMQKMVLNVSSSIRTDDELGTLSRNIDSLYLSLCENIENLKSEMIKVNKEEQYKADFMRAASHELKTPIAVLSGFLEGMIDNIGVYKNRDKYLLESKKTAEQLNMLVEEILNVSIIDNNEYEKNSEDIPLDSLIESILANYNTFIQDKNLKITKNLDSLTYCCDYKLLSHTISNLISNAVKYTKPYGAIKILLSETEGNLIFSIENECDKIKEEELTKLFEPFYILNYSRDKMKSGTGLGLYIVKRNLEALNLQHDVFNTKDGLIFKIYFDAGI